jgi:two-component system phosphate regulon response regulator PhoB
LVSQVLISAGHAYGWVTDCKQAMELLEWRRPDLLLLDQNMPEFSGSTVLRKLRASPKLCDLPVIMFTAVTGAEDEQQAFYHGAQDYIRKPFDKEFLLWSVNQILRRRAERPKHMELQEALKHSSGTIPDEMPRKRSVL